MSNYCKNCYELTEKLKAKEQECEELKQYKYLFEKTRNLWNESRMNNYKLLDEIKDLKDSLKRTICQSECYKHKEADKLKKTLTEIKDIVEGMHDLWINKTPYTDMDNLVKHLLECELNRIRYKLDEISECEANNDRK